MRRRRVTNRRLGVTRSLRSRENGPRDGDREVFFFKAVQDEVGERRRGGEGVTARVESIGHDGDGFAR